MGAYFDLQPAETELQDLAEQYWNQAGNLERQLEKDAFEAGESIRRGDYSLANLEAIVRWKSERLVHYIIANSNARIRHALEMATRADATTNEAMHALLELRGVDVPRASAILAAIYPERYIELDVEDLQALGQVRQDVRFYEEYLAFCRKLAERGIVAPQATLPGPTPLHTLDRALLQWTRNHAE